MLMGFLCLFVVVCEAIEDADMNDIFSYIFIK